MPTSNNSHFRKERVRVEGRTITLSNQDKVLFPDSGTTKGELIDYLRRLAPVMLPHLQGRPITRKRWPDGTGEDSFFQRDLDSSTPKWVPRQAVEHSERTVRYVVAADEATLTWLGQTACIELHVPQWRFTAEGLRGDPDRLVLDLDPGPGAGLAECAEVALAARELLDGVGLSSVPVTSGSKGLHLYAAIRDHTSDQAQEFAEELAEQLRQQLPTLVVTKMKRSLREKKVFIDHSQNNASKTTVSPYSPRGRGRALVAAPRAWAEVAEPSRLEQLEMAQVLERIGDGDPLAELLDDEPDRLAIYRSMRDATKTAEPVPEAGAPPPEPGEQPLFVVQEHHASSLHWDFRLENDGVLVSWAVPKGIPSDSGQNRLAVHTEDHPMEYAQFEGTIARGEYGAGAVTIWDSGTYSPVKWRDDEVIVDLRGERTQGRYALIQTGGKNWLLHRMKEEKQPATPAKSADAGGLGSDLQPMLATASEASTLDGDTWALEPKWDGYRVLVRFSAAGVRLTSRNGLDMSGQFSALAQLPSSLVGHIGVFDAEVVALDEGGRPSFQALQNATRHTPLRMMVFDVLHIDGTSLVNKPYNDRRRVLDAVPLTSADADGSDALWRRSGQLDGPLAEALALSARQGWEGVIAKRRDSRYQPGKRGRTWLKIKHRSSVEVLVGGWRPGQGARAGGIGSLLLGLPDGGGDGGVRYIGKVGTGFSEAELGRLGSTLGSRERKTSPFSTEVPRAESKVARWVRPDLVAEVAVGGWTEQGYVRHAVWRGLRPDKDPGDLSA